MEVHYKLMTFGIPTNLLPLTTDGEIELDNHQLWLEQRRHKEDLGIHKKDEVNTIELATVPGSSDIIMGREKIAREHLGNRRFLKMIQDNKEHYDSAPSKADKTLFATQMVHIIKESGGRFLKLEDIGWVEADEIMARDKITNAFRSVRKASIAKRNKAVNNHAQKKRQDVAQEQERGQNSAVDRWEVESAPSPTTDTTAVTKSLEGIGNSKRPRSR